MEIAAMNNVEYLIRTISEEGKVVYRSANTIGNESSTKATSGVVDVGEEYGEDMQILDMEVEGDTQVVGKDIILELCRVCGGGSERYMHVFGDEGQQHDLVDTIHKHLPLKISEDDSLPLQLCYDCATTLLAFDDMHRNCLDTQKRLRDIVSKMVVKIPNDQNELGIEGDIESIEEAGESTREQTQDDNRSNGADEMIEAFSPAPPSRSVSPMGLPSISVVGSVLPKAVAAEMPKFVGPAKDSKIPGTSISRRSITDKSSASALKAFRMRSVLKTSDVNQSIGRFNAARSLALKSAAAEKKNPSILRRSKTKKSPASLPNFSKEVKHSIPNTSIPDGGKGDEASEPPSKISRVLMELEVRKQKMKEKHHFERQKLKKKKYPCPECDLKLTSNYNLKVHMKVHEDVQIRIQCEACIKSFATLSSLRRHMRLCHENLKEYSCSFCNLMLATKSSREEHERTHTDERPYRCQHCSKRFRQRASLNVHKRFHEQTYEYPCKVCKKNFVRRQDLERHEITHTSEKPYPCTICGKKLSSSASLARHLKNHENKTDYICAMCFEIFPTKELLQTHLSVKHKEPGN